MAENQDELEKYGQPGQLRDAERSHIQLLTVIGEVEGHECLASGSKTTKYEHVIPMLAAVEENPVYEGLLVLINTVGGDVESGLAIAEMIASVSKPSVSLVLGGSHSIGVPLAVSTDYSFIVPTGTMMIHPVRMSGLIIGVAQTFDYFQKIQDRISGFVTAHSRIGRERLTQLMLETGELTKDVGSILVGEQAVREGIIDQVGGISDAYRKLWELMEERRRET
ncbi:MAG: ATP-dependent Clp protease proteolytic subunit [Eubacteriales bacterium]|nr:ATP-dependent Clp protease proteolytic subunit [Eubacteriales bacterium]